jgi:hypothetical protein
VVSLPGQSDFIGVGFKSSQLDQQSAIKVWSEKGWHQCRIQLNHTDPIENHQMSEELCDSV